MASQQILPEKSLRQLHLQEETLPTTKERASKHGHGCKKIAETDDRFKNLTAAKTMNVEQNFEEKQQAELYVIPEDFDERKELLLMYFDI